MVVDCALCGALTDRDNGVCFACHVRSIGFTFRGATPGRRGWHDATVRETKRDIYEGARANGMDITRV